MRLKSHESYSLVGLRHDDTLDNADVLSDKDVHTLIDLELAKDCNFVTYRKVFCFHKIVPY